MAWITFVNGKTQPIDSVKAIKLDLIKRGKRPGNPQIDKFLESVEHITFNANRTMKLPPKPIEQGRLPYND